ncbi:UNVERIFIED_CONTAM: hypothetical protein GTU68_056819 [Idotea baltica]|nr:hypothetical protein [Idotea baltica]
MKYKVITIFPELFEPFLNHGLVARGVERNQLDVDFIQLREHAINTHGQIDDTPYGGGSGMLLRCEPAAAAIREAKHSMPKAKVVSFSPRGNSLSTPLAKELAAQEDGLILIPYRYEGVDQRISDTFVDYEVSLGDFVLMGGELAAMALIEATARFVPGLLNNAESVVEESFSANLLEYPQYTKPNEFEGQKVPEILLSGNHGAIAKWRQTKSVEDTLERRPDLLDSLCRLPSAEISVALMHYPVMDKSGAVITSSITNLDVHDIARSSRTYGVSPYYIVHPTRALRKLADTICEHWDSGFGLNYNPNRAEALKEIIVVPEFNDVLNDIEARVGRAPTIVATSAQPTDRNVSFTQLRATLATEPGPFLILLGTGWGLAPEIMDRADLHLEPVCGFTEYNHLSVRAAAAIMFDRLVGDH